MNLDYSCVFQGLGSHGALYISNSKTASNFYLLQKLNIRAVLTAAKGHKIDTSQSKIQKYLYLEIEDYQDFDLEKYFQQAYSFIENARKLSNVLIHCHIGASRSVAVVMAYLIRKYSYSLPQIFSIVKRKRQLIQPNPGFIKQLEEYSQLYSVRSTEYTVYQPKPKSKVQRSVSFSTPNKEKGFQLSSNQRLIKSEELKEKIERMKEGGDLFKESKEKIDQLHRQREVIEEKLSKLRNGLIKTSGDSMRKKKTVGGQETIYENAKSETKEPKDQENMNPNKIENVELYDLVVKPQRPNRLKCKKESQLNKKKSIQGEVSAFSTEEQIKRELIKIPPMLSK